MKKILTFTESELEKIIHMVLESVNLDDYDNDDFIEVFFRFFRPWVKQKHGDEISEYPMSYLFKKYIDEFIKDLELGENRYWSSGAAKMANLGREIVVKGLHKLPNLSPKQSFLERFKKPVDFIIENLNLPSYMNFVLEEPSPYTVRGKFVVNFPELLKSESRPKRSLEYVKDFKKMIQDYMGIEIGPAAHGKLNLYVDSYSDFNGVDEWVKNVLDKEIKKGIRGLPGAKGNLHSIKFKPEPDGNYAEIKLSYKGYTSWNTKSEIKRWVKDYLANKGYNLDVLHVED